MYMIKEENIKMVYLSSGDEKEIQRVYDFIANSLSKINNKI